MSLLNLENLIKTGQLKIESFDQKEFKGLVNSGKTRLKDAKNESLAPESSFDLAYNAAHSFALAALRYHGYRTDKRYIVFQVLPFTLNIDSITSRILSKCHDNRNLAEYEGNYDIDSQLLAELLSATQKLLDRIELLMTKYLAECYCGAIKFYCDGEPYFTQYCHCNKCREVASQSKRDTDKQGYAWTAGYLTSAFHITSGIDNFDEIIRNNAKLLLCKSCHSLIYGISLDPSKQKGIGVNVNNIHFTGPIPEAFKPVRHIWYVNRIVNFNDNLPKFKDAPKEQFGSGEIWEDKI